MKAGLQTRLLLLTTLVLGTFLTLAGVVLERSFRASVLAGAEEQLQLVIYSLMGSVQDDGEQLRFSGELPEPRLHQPESGLYAVVRDANQRELWHSPSVITTGVRFPTEQPLNPGEFRFTATQDGQASRFFLSSAVIWEESNDSVRTFIVGTDQQPFRAAISGFRRNLYFGLGAVTIVFVLAQFLAVRWGLRPLRTMAGEVLELEEGQRDSLSSGYPLELQGLAENLDRFIAHEHRSRTRYRKAMEDLAHSLKTPLAVIRNALSDDPATKQIGLLTEQLDRMETTVTHQLSRASVSGPVIVGRAVNLCSLVDRLLRALHSAYADRDVKVDLLLPPDLSVRGDERDLMEILGNLLENAFKYTRSRISIRGELNEKVAVIIEDDGPGIEPQLRKEVLNRGARGDQVQPGQGIGLAMVQDLLEVYEGELEIGQSRWGGALIRLTLP